MKPGIDEIEGWLNKHGATSVNISPDGSLEFRTTPEAEHIERFQLLMSAEKEVERLEALINTPETTNFWEGVKREAAHQRERWGEPHDREKSAEHWFWLVGYLAGKALRAAITSDREKARHHTISTAAALSHWHAAMESRQLPDADLAAHDSAPTSSEKP